MSFTRAQLTLRPMLLKHSRVEQVLPVVFQVLKSLALVCLVGLTGLSACAPFQTGKVTKPLDKMTLGDLPRRDINVEPQELEPISSERLLATYDQAVALFSTQQERAQALRRMADVTMTATEDSMIESLDETPQSEYEDFDPTNEYIKAVAIYEAIIIAADPSDDLSEEYYLLAKAYEMAGEQEKAIATLDILVEKYPDGEFVAEAQFRRGEYLFQIGEYEQAAAAYGFLIKAGPDSDFYEHSLYKHGWSLYKQGDFDLAINDFSQLLDRYWPTPAPAPAAAATTDPSTTAETNAPIVDITLPEVSKSQRKLLDDTLRVMAMSFSNLEGADSAAQFFDKNGQKIYEHELYNNLAELYLRQERYKDAADTYAQFSATRPLDPKAPNMSAKVITTYEKGGFPSQVLTYKQGFIEQYGLYSVYWLKASEAQRAQYANELKQNIIDLAQHEHAIAQQTGNVEDYHKAARWYREFLDTYPQEERSPKINMLLAESLFSAKDFRPAIKEFERTSYDYPKHPDDEKAGYFSLLAYQETINSLPKDDPTRNDWIAQRATSSMQFAKYYPANENIPKVLDNAIEDRLLLEDIDGAIETAQVIINLDPPAPEALQEKAWITYANAKFDKGHWVAAEQSIKQILTFDTLSKPQRKNFEERLATSIYKQAEALQEQGQLAEAADEYLRAAMTVPTASVAANAEYDSANLSLQLEDYDRAINVLESFRKNYPKHELTAGVPAKLSLAYQKTNNLAKASAELITVAALSKSSNPALAREALYQAAEMTEQSGDLDGAIKLYKDYVWTYEQPVAPRMEAQYHLVQLYEQKGDSRKRYFWLNKLTETHASAGDQQTDRSLYLAAYGSFNSAEALFQDFNAIALRQPLKKSLGKKKAAMQEASKAYSQTIQYGVIDFTTAANFKLGEIYRQFARSIMDSERPRGLDELALEEYELLLEDQAIPLEDKAIAIFKTNTERTTNGVWDKWIEQSYQSLSKLSPARYNKQELEEAYINVVY